MQLDGNVHKPLGSTLTKGVAGDAPAPDLGGRGREDSCCFVFCTWEVSQLLRQGHGCPVLGMAGKTLDGLPVLEIEPKAGRQPWALSSDPLLKIDLV